MIALVQHPGTCNGLLPVAPQQGQLQRHDEQCCIFADCISTLQVMSSCFHCLDEFDVFMDIQHRRVGCLTRPGPVVAKQ